MNAILINIGGELYTFCMLLIILAFIMTKMLE